MNQEKIDPLFLLKELTQIGIALSAEKRNERLLEMILIKAKELTNADGATLYECIDDQQLKFEIMLTGSLNFHLGGTSGKKIDLDNLSLYDAQGKPNEHMVATWVANNNQTVNIKDASAEKKFDFSGTFKLDKKIGYHSKSFLTVPMTNHLNEVIGVLQLINAQDRRTKKIISFSKKDRQIVESLASQAAVSITNRRLIEAQKNLFDSLIKLIANAIDEKSPYTASHCQRVPVITRMLAEAACRIDKGPLKDFTMTEDEKYELDVAAWLHDCGKITTPEYVVNKATKLETIFDRIQLVDTRFEVLKRDLIIANLQRQLNKPNQPEPELEQQLLALEQDRNFIRECNIGKETITDDEIARIMKIAQQKWLTSAGREESFLTDEEVNNLKVARGTLTSSEREVINNHVKVTAQMLGSLPYPRKLKKVPEYASSHHEKMDGTGYPRGLTGKQMAIPARMIAIADIFEALTANDRPYKKAMPLSQCLAILGKMKKEGHIDPDLFDVFIHEKIYLDYANNHLDKSSIDEIDLDSLPGYKPL